MSMNFQKLNEHDLNRVAVSMVYNALPSDRTKIKATDILGQNAPYDILWGDKKLCVRIANMSTKSRFPKWNYTVATVSKRNLIDFFVFIAIKNNLVFNVFVLPFEIAPKTTITITERLGELRYEMLTTPLEKVGDKILSVGERLPELVYLYREGQK